MLVGCYYCNILLRFAGGASNIIGKRSQHNDYSDSLALLLPILPSGPHTITVMKAIAVVENSQDNRLLLRAILSGSYRIVEYETGFEALTAFQESLPDLILMDIALPGMDGVEVLGRIRANPHWKHRLVIALTAHAMSGDRERFLTSGFDDYIAKPIIDEQVLFRTLEFWLQKNRSRKLKQNVKSGLLLTKEERWISTVRTRA